MFKPCTNIKRSRTAAVTDNGRRNRPGRILAMSEPATFATSRDCRADDDTDRTFRSVRRRETTRRAGVPGDAAVASRRSPAVSRRGLFASVGENRREKKSPYTVWAPRTRHRRTSRRRLGRGVTTAKRRRPRRRRYRRFDADDGMSREQNAR